MTDVGSEVTATADWDFRECSQAIRAITRHRPGPAWIHMGKRVALLVLILGGLFLIYGFAVQGYEAVVGGISWILLILFWIALLSGGFAWITAWQLKRNNPHMASGMEHHISAAGYTVRCGPVTSTTGWEGIQRFVDTPTFFLIFPVKNAAYYLPKRALTTTAIDDIRRLARSHLLDGSRYVAV